MAIKGVSITVQYVAWDTAASAGKTADVANHTLRLVKDGTSEAPANAAAEVDATNAPGVYKLVLTAAEMGFNVVTLCGKSATASVSIIPITIATEGGKLADIETDTGAIGAAGAGLTALGDTRLANLDAAVSSRSTLAAGAEMDLVAAPNATAVTAIQAGLSTHSATDVWAAVTRTLTANTNLNDPTAAIVADAVLDELMSGHVGVGSLGKAVADVLADTNELQGNQSAWATATGFETTGAAATAVGTLNNLDSTAVQSAATAALTAYGPPTTAEVTTAVQALLTTDLTGYESTASGMRLADILVLLRGMIVGKIAISGTTLTVYEADGITTMAIYTIGSDYSTRSVPS